MRRKFLFTIMLVLFMLGVTSCRPEEQETYVSKRHDNVETAFDSLFQSKEESSGTVPAPEKKKLKELPLGGYLVKEELKVFEKESVTSDILFSVAPGEILDITARDGDWAKVLYGEETGFVRYDVLYLSLEIPDSILAEGEAPKTYVVKENALVLRASPGKNSPSYATLAKGEEVEFLEPVDHEGEVWAHVLARGFDGFVKMEFIEEKSDLSPAPHGANVPPSPPGEPAPVAQGPRTVIVDRLTLRGGMSMSAQPLVTVNRGVSVNLLQEEVNGAGEKWSYVEVNGTRGYVLSRYISGE